MMYQCASKPLREELLALRIGQSIKTSLRPRQAEDVCRRANRGSGKFFGYLTVSTGVLIRRYE